MMAKLSGSLVRGPKFIVPQAERAHEQTGSSEVAVIHVPERTVFSRGDQSS